MTAFLDEFFRSNVCARRLYALTQRCTQLPCGVSAPHAADLALGKRGPVFNPTVCIHAIQLQTHLNTQKNHEERMYKLYLNAV